MFNCGDKVLFKNQKRNKRGIGVIKHIAGGILASVQYGNGSTDVVFLDEVEIVSDKPQKGKDNV